MRRATLVVLAFLAFIAVARAGDSGPLTELLRDRQNRIDAVLAKYPGELSVEGKVELKQVLSGAFDFDEMARGSLGRSWEEHSAEQQATFVASFRRLVQASWVRKPDIYRAKSIEYETETLDGDEGKVKTLVSRKDALTDVDYTFHRTGDAWSVIDYRIDGVSAVRNYRSQFRSLLKKRGWDGLIQRLDERSEKLETEGVDENDEES